MRRATVLVVVFVCALGWYVARAGGGYEKLGTPGDDTLTGSSRGGGMNGLGGNDSVIGRGYGKDIAYGGEGDDLVEGNKNAPASTDDLFGGGFCSETGYYGFPSLGTTNDLPCSIDGADIIRGGSGDDWLWESNSDNFGDGAVDVLNGGTGHDVCVAEAIDVVTRCEDVRIVPTLESGGAHG